MSCNHVSSFLLVCVSFTVHVWVSIFRRHNCHECVYIFMYIEQHVSNCTLLCVYVSLSFINMVQKGGVDGELPKQKI